MLTAYYLNSYNDFNNILKMKYSFSIDQDIASSPFKTQAAKMKAFPSLHQTTSLEILLPDLLKFSKILNLNQQECFTQARPEITVKADENIKFEDCRCLWAGQDQWILIQQSPLKLYVVLNKYQKIAAIVLEQKIDLSQISCYVVYPQIIIYGHNRQKFTNHLYSINLNTFEIKQLTNTKDYSPGHRSQYWAYFTDGRLYLFGGKDKKGNYCQSLFWTYNLQNGNWFALDFNDNGFNLTNKSLSLQIETGKVLSIENGKAFMVQLYQSRIKQIQEIHEKLGQAILHDIEGLFINDGYIYLHRNSMLIPLRLKLIKTKITK